MLGQHTEFYPSTHAIARKIEDIVSKYRYGTSKRSVKERYRIIDPSAGNGVLLDALKGYTLKKSVFNAIEIDPDLRHILAGKGYTVLDSNWLKYREHVNFDIIIMNPPFSDGIHHILKAWEYLADDGLLVSVVPDTYLDEGNSHKQRLAALIAQFGTVESIGSAFENAVRSTGVKCSIISLVKPKAAPKNWFEDLNLEEESFNLGDDFAANPLAHPDQIESLVSQYEIVCQCAIDRYKSQQKLEYFLRGITRPVTESYGRSNDPDFKCLDNIETQLSIIKSRFWNTLFQKTKIGSKTTSAFRKKFDEGSLEMAKMAFTKGNILEILSMFFENRESIMQDCIKDVFNTCTKYHGENCVHHEGWKNNKSSKIANKIIIPTVNLHDSLGWSTIYRDNRFSTFCDDFDKVLCWITGINQADPRFKGLIDTINEQLQLLRSSNWDKSIDVDYTDELTSTFFRIKIFKKGTIHLRFIDQKVQNAFNLAASKGSKAIGADY
jgi:Domain of unknown function (DUF4942)